MVGSTKYPLLESRFPPYNTFPPYLLTLAKALLYISTAAALLRGPQRVAESRGSPILTEEYALTNLSTK